LRAACSCKGRRAIWGRGKATSATWRWQTAPGLHAQSEAIITEEAAKALRIVEDSIEIARQHRLPHALHRNLTTLGVVRYDNGAKGLFTQSTPPSWHRGDKVRVINGAIQSNG